MSIMRNWPRFSAVSSLARKSRAYISSPRLAIYSPVGEWEVENEGVAPDVEVEMTPRLVIEGRDPQLERALEIVLAELDANPRTAALRPLPAARALAERT